MLRAQLTSLRRDVRWWRYKARMDARHFREVRAYLERRLGSLAGLRVLDLGCGATFNQLLLFHSLGGPLVVGLDLTPVALRPTSPRDALRWLVYYGTLARSAGVLPRLGGLRVLCADAQRLPLVGESFDVVISNATFEHLPDVPAAVREIRRVLRPGGLTYIGIHLWTSPSGSHHPAVPSFPLRAERWPSGLAPWFHLRRLPPYDPSRAPTYGYQRQPLNCWREAQYRAAFERELRVVDWIRLAREGRELLTDEVRAALPGYSEDELTTRSLRVVAVKEPGER